VESKQTSVDLKRENWARLIEPEGRVAPRKCGGLTGLDALDASRVQMYASPSSIKANKSP
jgi:hypothetical protein